MKRAARRLRQRGVMGLLLVSLLILGGVLFAYTSLNVASVHVDRERATNTALAKAKDALIAFAASHTNDVPVAGAPARPGQLPCPDVTDDGIQDSDATGSCTSLIGRLPWVTLELPDLRDDSGERLWYVVSNDFRTDYNLPPAVPLNSDTAYRTGNASLTIAGTTPAANLAAIVISPGRTLTRSDARAQVRGCGAVCDPRDFLDIAAAEDNGDANTTFVAAPRSTSFNDTLLPLFSDDIMRLVERRAARELAMHLRNHYDMWEGALVNNTKGFYPFAATFNDPSAPQLGTNGNPAGLLPLSTAPLTWSNFPPLAGGNGCWTASGGTVLHCRTPVVCVALVCLLTVPISGRVENVATRFVDPPLPPVVVRLNGLFIGTGGASWTLNAAARRLEFDYTYGLLAAGLLELEVAAPASSAWLATSWLTANNWHQDAGYVLSSGYAIDGSGSCGGAGPSCITLQNTTAPNNTKHAVVMASGRSLSSAGQTARPIAPPASATEFFEGQNPDVTYTVLEANARTATFNDTPVAVRP